MMVHAVTQLVGCLVGWLVGHVHELCRNAA